MEPVVQSPEEAQVLVAVISHGLATMPVNGARRRMLQDIRFRVRYGGAGATSAGSVAGTAPESARQDLVDVVTASTSLGVTTRSVTKRCAAGQIPGARKIAGRWLIPAEALPEQEPPE